MRKPKMHGHPAFFGSGLNCKYCNPICWQNHPMSTTIMQDGTVIENKIIWCGNNKCPLKKWASDEEKQIVKDHIKSSSTA